MTRTTSCMGRMGMAWMWTTMTMQHQCRHLRHRVALRRKRLTGQHWRQRPWLAQRCRRKRSGLVSLRKCQRQCTLACLLSHRRRQCSLVVRRRWLLPWLVRPRRCSHPLQLPSFSMMSRPHVRPHHQPQSSRLQLCAMQRRSAALSSPWLRQRPEQRLPRPQLRRRRNRRRRQCLAVAHGAQQGQCRLLKMRRMPHMLQSARQLGCARRVLSSCFAMTARCAASMRSTQRQARASQRQW